MTNNTIRQEMSCSVENTLEVTISGSGTVYYRGNPTIMDHTNRAGSIINAN